MFSLVILSLVAAYMAVLFAVAWRGERRAAAGRPGGHGPWIYALSLAIYCTSWTYYGAVGTGSRAGWEFVPIYIGPIIGLTLLFPLWRRIAAAAGRENVGSIADFLSSRYGKSQTLGVLVSLVAIVGSLPYIALQLKSLAMGWELVTEGTPAAGSETATVLVIAGVLAGFSILFGARRPDLTEHNRGLIQAIALESIVKLAALVAVALFAAVLLMRAPSGEAIRLSLGDLAQFPHLDARFLIITMLSTLAIFCLPRQFHVGFVEGSGRAQIKHARWVFPIYLLITCIAVLPLVAAGKLAGLSSNPDLLVLALPFSEGARILTALVFVGGFSAATAMVIVETVALSAMASNSLILPLVAGERWRTREAGHDMAGLILQIRRGAIVVLMLMAWLYFRALDHSSGLASIGLISFAALAQLAPALLGAVLWRGGHSRGAIAGIIVGITIWLIMLAAPPLIPSLDRLMSGMGDAFSAGVVISLGLNTAVYVAVSRVSRMRLIDRVQARAFVDRIGPEWIEPHPGQTGALIGDLKTLVARFIGDAGAARAFAAWAQESGRSLKDNEPADAVSARAAERMLAGAVGASSARRVIAAALSGGGRAPQDVVRMLDEASEAVQFNRELLQTTLDNIDQGVSVVDNDLRLIAWNRRYVEMFNLPPGFVHVGLSIAAVYRLNAERGEAEIDGDIEQWIERRLEALKRRIPHEHERRQTDGRILRSSGAPISGVGYATSYTDITELRRAARELQEANERLEARVAARTRDLDEARRAAEDATASKTRFLAAASHDLLQPLHASRLFIAAMKEEATDPEMRSLARNADRAIENAHGLMTALLNLSKLEAGGVSPSVAPTPLSPLFDDLERAFASAARAKGVSLVIAPTSLWVASDRDLLNSMLQNLIGNALRYTDRGRVLVGARRRADGIEIMVLDTGRGIAEAQRETIFAEFTRLPGAPNDEPGAGLGLAIVRKLGQLLGHRLQLSSQLGKGSVFSVTTPRARPIQQVEASPAPARHGVSLSGLSVLCVDNEPAILDGLTALLRRWGARPTAAPDAASAAAKGALFDAALVDFHLGDGPDGLSVARELKSRGVTRIALITADTDETLKAQARELGLIILPKPVKPAALKAFLSR